MPDAPLPSQIVVILGMHRSGTSTVTRSLSLLGYTLPKTLIKGNASNRRGHWESQPIARLNDQYLNDADLTWADWGNGKLDIIGAETRRDFEQDIRATIADEFPAGQAAVLKEPRICRLVPIYRAALADHVQLAAVITIRNPLEVIASLAKRNNMSETNACLLWLRYMLDAVSDSEGLPRAFIAYEDCMADPKSALRSMAQHAELAFPNELDVVGAEIDEYFNPTFRHHTHTPEDVLHHDLTNGWVSDVYNALLVLKHDPNAINPLETIARVRSEFAVANPMLSFIIGDFDSTCKELTRREYALSAALDLKTQQVNMIRPEALRANELSRDLIDEKQRSEDLRMQLETAQEEQRLQLRDEKQRSDDLAEQLATAHEELTTLQGSLEFSDQQLEAAQTDLKAARKSVRKLKANLNQARKDVDAAELARKNATFKARFKRFRRKIKGKLLKSS